MVLYFFMMLFYVLPCVGSYVPNYVVTLEVLKQEGVQGNVISAQAYDTFLDLVLQSYPRYWHIREVRERLWTRGLCDRINNECIPKPEALENCLRRYKIDSTLKRV